MTRIHLPGEVPVISVEPVGRCEICGKIAETRPYGPNREEVCFSCGMKNEEAAKKAFGEFLEGGQ